MPATWKTVRVFISSTFRDMHAERDHLVKVTFPALRERLEKYRIYLDDIDLRWGVTREQAENDQVLDLCLQQIDECRPFFIGILGERYGWVPTRYPADALKKFGWIQHHTGKSVTELEILHGVLENRQMRDRAFFYFRDPMAIQSVPESIRREVYAETDRVQIEKQLELKSKIRLSGCPVMENYPARWDPDAYDRPSRSKGRLVDLNEFGQRVHDQLWQAIQEEFQLSADAGQTSSPSQETVVDPLAEEQDYHARFMESRLRVYVGREQINDALLAYVDGNAPFPCLVTGPSGSGKSAALARFVQTFSQSQIANLKSKTLIIPHFIGASPRSTNLRDMLRRFCQVLKAHFGFDDDVPEEVAKLSSTFREFVAKVPSDTRVLLVIDAVNQLDEADRAQELFWLPSTLLPHVKVIVSCITEVGVQASAASSTPQPALKAFRNRKHHPIQLAALSDEEQRLIIRQVPSLSAKTLDDDQVHLLLSNPATANPLFLLVALEELRGFAPYERLNERIAAFPREGDTVTGIFTQVIERLAEEFNSKLVETILTLLASARRGLSERELQELHAGLDGADDLFPVLRQLRPYLLSRAGLIDFYHRNLFKAVRERHLPSDEHQRESRSRLIEYFYAQDYWLESVEDQRIRSKTLPPTPRPANVRKVDELPWHLLQGADWPRFEELLTDLAFLEAKAEAGMVFDLAADFDSVIREMSTDRPRLQILRLLDEALRRDIHFIERHPTSLFQCMWNSCWWYDCKEAESHYVEPTGESLKHTLSWNHSKYRLSTLLERWLALKQHAHTGFRWIRSLLPPHFRLGGPTRAVLVGHEDAVTSVAFSPDGTIVASGSWSLHYQNADYNKIILWSVTTGSRISELLDLEARFTNRHSTSRFGPHCHNTGCEAAKHGHCNRMTSVHCIAYHPNGSRIATGSWDHQIRVWDVATGQKLACIHGHFHTVTCIAFSPDGCRLASGSVDGTIRVWDSTTFVELFCLHGECGAIWSLGFSTDGRFIAFGADDSVVHIWCPSDPFPISCLNGHSNEVHSVAYSLDGQWLASAAKDNTIRVWDLDVGSEHACLNVEAINRVMFSADGRFLIGGSGDGSVWIWNTTSFTEIRVFRGHQAGVSSLAVTQNHNLIATASYDRTIRLWDIQGSDADMKCIYEQASSVEFIHYSWGGDLLVARNVNGIVSFWDTMSGRFVEKKDGHSERVVDTAFSPDSRHVASASRDGTARIWRVSDGKLIGILNGHSGGVNCVTYSHRGRLVATGGEDKIVRIWNRESLQLLSSIEGSQTALGSVAFSLDDCQIATASDLDNCIRIWNVASGKEVVLAMQHDGGVTCLEYSPDGRYLASSSMDKTVRLWSVDTYQEVARFSEHTGEVHAICFSADGTRLASASEDMTIRVRSLVDLYNVQSTRIPHHKPIYSLAFSPNGHRIIWGSNEDLLYTWNLDDPVPLDGNSTEPFARHAITGSVFAVAYSSDGSWIASAGERTVEVRGAHARNAPMVLVGIADPFLHQQGIKSINVASTSVPQETVITRKNTRECLGHIPAIMQHIATHPKHAIIAGAFEKRVYMFRLEGNWEHEILKKSF